MSERQYGEPVVDEAVSPAEELDRLEREFALRTERVASLERATRVLEVETGAWVRPATSGALKVSLFALGLSGFLLGMSVTGLLLSWIRDLVR